MTCTAGARALREHRPERHADMVQRLEDAGAIILGKTNVPVYATDVQSYNKLFGVTNNPHNAEHTPGGSSGGADGYRTLATKLADQGALVSEARHPLLSLEHILPAYFNLLGSLMSTALKPAQRRQLKWTAL